MKRIALMIALLGAGLPAMADEIQRQITITGEGAVQMAPDMAVISLGVTQQAKDAAQAMSRASEAAAQVLDRLSGMGIAPRDVQTSSVNLSPIYARRQEAGPMVVEGFRAGLSMSVRVRDLPKLGAVLGAVVQDGANQFSGLQFALSKPQEAQDAARKDAVADALRKANLYAQAAGVSLGDVLQISENGGYHAPKMRMAAADMAESVPIAEGELNISQSVTLVIGLE